MISNFLLAVSLVVISVVANPIPAPGTGCAAVHIITTRASTELPGAGIIGDVVGGVVSRSRQGVSREAIDYPALLTPYLTSKTAGVTELKRRLASKAAACPNTKIVLMGYSQGAHVSGDVLADRATGSDKVVGVVLMGDPGHVRGESFQKGTANLFNGLFPRSSGALEGIASKIVSYCDFGDPFCAGGLDTIGHLAYVVKYGRDAETFILGRIGG